MRYVPAQEMKGSGTAYEGIEHSTSWTVRDGVLERLFAGKPASAAVLDVGCGNGANLALFRRLGATTLAGVDLDEYLASDLRPVVDFRTLDLNRDALPWPDATFDVVACLQVAEHLENPFHLAREAARVLKPGGLFLLSVPNHLNLTFRLKFLLTGEMPPWTATNNHLQFVLGNVFRKTYLALFDEVATEYQRGDLPLYGILRRALPFLRMKHARVLPPSRPFGRRVLHVLKKRS